MPAANLVLSDSLTSLFLSQALVHRIGAIAPQSPAGHLFSSWKSPSTLPKSSRLIDTQRDSP
jgi:hypothetical protein